jgi:hypothetical protein
MRILFYTLIFLCATHLSFAQIRVRGIIVDENKEVVSFATIGIKGTSKALISNDEGVFTLQVDSLPLTLQVSALGFERKEIRVNQTSITVELQSKSFALNEVTIKANAAFTIFNNAFKKLLKPGYRLCNQKLFYRLNTKNNDVNTEMMEAFYDVQSHVAGFYNWQLTHGRYALVENFKADKFAVSIDFSSLVRYVDILNEHGTNIHFPQFPFTRKARNYTIFTSVDLYILIIHW